MNQLSCLTEKDNFRTVLMKKIYGYVLTKTICSCVELGIPDLLESDPLDINQLADKINCPVDSLKRFMDFLIAEGIFLKDTKQFYSNNELSILLTSKDGSLRNLARLHGHEFWWEMWGGFTECLKNDTSYPQLKMSKNIFEILEMDLHQDKKAYFDFAMRDLAIDDAHNLIKKMNISKYNSIIDVGGGSGILISIIKSKFPEKNCSILERKSTILMSDLLSKNIQFIRGDFFDHIPEHYDLYILRHIIHNWNDDLALKILKNCRIAMSYTSSLYILEFITDEHNSKNIVSYRDLHMLVTMPNGLERPLSRFKTLLTKSKLRIETITPLPSNINIIECKIC